MGKSCKNFIFAILVSFFAFFSIAANSQNSLGQLMQGSQETTNNMAVPRSMANDSTSQDVISNQQDVNPWLAAQEFIDNENSPSFSIKLAKYEFYENELIEFDLELINAEASSSPDLSVLPSEFQIVEQAQSSQLVYNNYSSQNKTIWSYRVKANQIGLYQIAPVTVLTDNGMFSTQPFAITVKDAAALPSSTDDGGVFIDTRVSNDMIFVGQPFLVSVRVFLRDKVRSADIIKPEVNGIDFVQVGDVKLSTQYYDNIAYDVREVFYKAEITPSLLNDLKKIPQNSNNTDVTLYNYKIPAFQLRGERVLSDGFSQGFGGLFGGNFFGSSQPANELSFIIASEQIPITIGYHDDLSGKPVFKEVEIKTNIEKTKSDYIESSNTSKSNDADYELGQPITISIKLTGLGNNSSKIPDFNAHLSADGFKVYPDKPKSEDIINGDITIEDKYLNSFLALKEQSFTIIPQRAGELSIPVLSLEYFDPQAGLLKGASSEKKIITVKDSDTTGKQEVQLPYGGNSTAAQQQYTQLGDSFIDNVQNNKSQALQEQDEQVFLTDSSEPEKATSSLWFYSSLALAIIVFLLVIFILYLYQKMYSLKQNTAISSKSERFVSSPHKGDSINKNLLKAKNNLLNHLMNSVEDAENILELRNAIRSILSRMIEDYQADFTINFYFKKLARKYGLDYNNFLKYTTILDGEQSLKANEFKFYKKYINNFFKKLLEQLILTQQYDNFIENNEGLDSGKINPL